MKEVILKHLNCQFLCSRQTAVHPVPGDGGPGLRLQVQRRRSGPVGGGRDCRCAAGGGRRRWWSARLGSAVVKAGFSRLSPGRVPFPTNG